MIIFGSPEAPESTLKCLRNLPISDFFLLRMFDLFSVDQGGPLMSSVQSIRMYDNRIHSELKPKNATPTCEEFIGIADADARTSCAEDMRADGCRVDFGVKSLRTGGIPVNGGRST